ncbi:MAG: glycosyltransferase [Pseudomonadota bacterium]
MNNKKILFLSALDFKEKSIQVIRKTPEAYAKAGWDVHYVVARDESRHSNYCYEKVIEVEGVKTYRFNWPLQWIRDQISSRISLLLLTKVISLLVVIRLAWNGAKILHTTKIDVVYGYEVHGVLAIHLLSLFGLNINKDKRKVSRFQGTFLNEMIEAKQYGRILFNFDLFLALWLPSHLCIMTDDGTQGDKALLKISSKNLPVLHFWVNGVDVKIQEAKQVEKIRDKLNPLAEVVVFLSVSRLVNWKRVDRGIRVLSVLKDKYKITAFKYIILGEGQERTSLEALAKDLGLSKQVLFLGAVPNSEVRNYLEVADYFISTYDSSNVGNPLLEALGANKIIFTLNNGDTNRWIQHGVNGFIYDVDDNFFGSMARDMYAVMRDTVLRTTISRGAKETAATKLWSWQERLDAEINAVGNLFLQ